MKMETAFFLASNSGKGFYSLYDEFPGDNAYLHIIKGGPGTGKSGFMRRVAQAAKERGMDTELIYCSGDPDSLDGLYIPALKQAWMDGTAPHVREPGIFGADSDYVNLGDFCSLPLNLEEAERAADINRRYKALYTSAYSYLEAERAVAESEEEHVTKAEQAENIIREIFRKEHSKHQMGMGRPRRRFISAISCRGRVRLEDTVKKLCKQNYLFEPSLAQSLLPLAAEKARALGLDAILCPEPLRPDRLEAVILPAQGIYLGAEPDDMHSDPVRGYLREQATGLLSRAKALHDELEAVYRPAMDFAALTEFTDKYIENLFE